MTPEGGAVLEAEETFVCRCLKVTETALVEAIRSRRLRSVDDVRRCTEAGEGCTACHPALRRYLKRYSLASDVPNCSAK